VVTDTTRWEFRRFLRLLYFSFDHPSWIDLYVSAMDGISSYSLAQITLE
jgi:hypothetical protein